MNSIDVIEDVVFIEIIIVTIENVCMVPVYSTIETIVIVIIVLTQKDIIDLVYYSKIENLINLGIRELYKIDKKTFKVMLLIKIDKKLV